MNLIRNKIIFVHEFKSKFFIYVYDDDDKVFIAWKLKKALKIFFSSRYHKFSFKIFLSNFVGNLKIYSFSDDTKKFP